MDYGHMNMLFQATVTHINKNHNRFSLRKENGSIMRMGDPRQNLDGVDLED